MALEIVDLPIENGGSFHSYVNVYQRVLFMVTPLRLMRKVQPHGRKRKSLAIWQLRLPLEVLL